MGMGQSKTTDGAFDTEAGAFEIFDHWVTNSGKFKLFKEVVGEYIHPRIGTYPMLEDGAAAKNRITARIDRILIPGQDVIEAGWEDGPIGIEGKRSDKKAGPLITQALDYSRCIFKLNHGFMVMLKWIFIFPFDNPGCDLESIMANHRIGYIPRPFKALMFCCGGMNAIKLRDDGSIEAKNLPMGNKRGSR